MEHDYHLFNSRYQTSLNCFGSHITHRVTCNIDLQVKHSGLLHKIVIVKPHFRLLAHDENSTAYWLVSNMGLIAVTSMHRYLWRWLH